MRPARATRTFTDHHGPGGTAGRPAGRIGVGAHRDAPAGGVGWHSVFVGAHRAQRTAGPAGCPCLRPDRRGCGVVFVGTPHVALRRTIITSPWSSPTPACHPMDGGRVWEPAPTFELRLTAPMTSHAWFTTKRWRATQVLPYITPPHPRNCVHHQTPDCPHGRVFYGNTKAPDINQAIVRARSRPVSERV